MDILTDSELKQLINSSELISKYNEEIDRESAYEILTKKIETAEETEAKEKAKKDRKEVTKTASRRRTGSTEGAIIKVLTSATFVRGVLGILNKFLK
ncbi:MAG: DUF853 domain-containing protein, partial [Gramella sp.]|nr:DUF853 domain-containing protein [Christiangramia sp.]